MTIEMKSHRYLVLCDDDPHDRSIESHRDVGQKLDALARTCIIYQVIPIGNGRVLVEYEEVA